MSSVGQKLSSTCLMSSVESGYGWMFRKCLPKDGPWSSLLLHSMLTAGIISVCEKDAGALHEDTHPMGGCPMFNPLLKGGRRSRSAARNIGHMKKANHVKVLFSIFFCHENVSCSIWDILKNYYSFI